MEEKQLRNHFAGLAMQAIISKAFDTINVHNVNNFCI